MKGSILVVTVCSLFLVYSGQAGASITYKFTATDGVNVGTGTFSYDLNMVLTSISPTESLYTPNLVHPAVSTTFTSSAGAFSSNDPNGFIYVFHNDPTYHDLILITTIDTIGGKTYYDTLTFQNNLSTALSSTALPTSINLTSFPDQHTLTYYDPAIGNFHTFTITSVTTAVPEPSSILLTAIATTAAGYVSWRRRKPTAFASSPVV